MSDAAIAEEPVQIGDGGRLFGVLTLPSSRPTRAQPLPVFVFLSAGLLHRVGPHRLHVRLARRLAAMGLACLRVDLAGRGDSPERNGFTNQQAAAADFSEILALLDSRFGQVPLVLAGLCAGADNAIRLALRSPRVVGMLLLDPICTTDEGFAARSVARKYLNAARYVAWLRQRWSRVKDRRPPQAEGVDSISLRDVPSLAQMRDAFTAIRDRQGLAMSVFTQYALAHYNQQGQLGRVLGVEGYREFSTEVFWPEAEHTFTLELHRLRLMQRISEWAAGFIHK